LKPQAVVIGLNSRQVDYIKAIKKLGYYVLGIDGNPAAPGVKICDEHICLRYDEYEQVLQRLLLNDTFKPCAVFTAAAQFSHILAAKIANQYNIIYPNIELVSTILDKARFYKLFESHGIPIPPTELIFAHDEMQQKLTSLSPIKRCYIKSDFSKNPKYVYNGLVKDLRNEQINWTPDTFYRNCYILQPEITGANLRLNISGNVVEVYNFNTGIELDKIPTSVEVIITDLIKLCEAIGLIDWIVKFDVIATENSYVVLDIGIDPPSRMREKFKKAGEDFPSFYIEKYFNAFG
jgi:hypothetical protein